MKYFIDHKKKRIHHSSHAGTQCDFFDTPIQKREFTTNLSYVTKLEREEHYAKCPHCRELLSSSS
ncbi:hypothetical protein [Jeotgalibacillus campisalis]|uniref:Uncharacterized protein n=1 Tax=Jeotgalibacillus campisalis TaxID=220754 RepID=A0A0C2W3C9_9BACL|nr:hypothetical protein [Jeotgalibacillus campisalis]KIL51131.1 hypothetical protein KR50_10120 [Jeotgalibacillus campisalis]